MADGWLELVLDDWVGGARLVAGCMAKMDVDGRQGMHGMYG